MSNGVFSKGNQPVNHPKRNVFDLSRQNNLTMQFGNIYPCFCQEVIPGDTFRIRGAFGLRMMPLVFPTQTKMRCDVHFFYVRNRNLWDGWQDFIGNQATDLVPPYLASSDMPIVTKSLADYLGVPTSSIVNNVGFSNTLSSDEFTTNDNNFNSTFPLLVKNRFSKPDNTIFGFPVTYSSLNLGAPVYNQYGMRLRIPYRSGQSLDSLNLRVSLKASAFSQNNNITFIPFLASTDLFDDDGTHISKQFNESTLYALPINNGLSSPLIASDGSTLYDFDPNDVDYLGQHGSDFVEVYVYFAAFSSYSTTPADTALMVNQFMEGNEVFILFSQVLQSSTQSQYVASSYPTRISALPFRAYESIYNAFYRDSRNNPYILNGKEEYNQYIPTKEGGADTNVYDIHQRNWEQDFLTTAMKSPQAGIAPLVGITSTGRASFSTDKGIYEVDLDVASDGDTVVGASIKDDTPDSVRRSIVDIASSGISINDFRAVNALQRWAETNLRIGLKYRDIIRGHFGVTPSYAELDMPEFIGGFSKDVAVNQINQTSQTTEGDPLGSFAGQAAVIGGSKHDINHYCDEHGFIIGVISVVPVPTYSQLLPKHFTKQSPLDYFFPEFGHIGFQPIPYREVCPLQVPKADLDMTFGYQRAWYDYLSSTDEVHGDFRDTLSNFILMRTFNSAPSINNDFLTVHNNQLNNIFADTGNYYDKILGSIYFEVRAKRPIPRFGIPRLE